MSDKIINCSRLHENYREIKHSSGLTLLLYPMQDFSGIYSLFATKYGSVDTCFKTQNDTDFVTVPDGIAHFLEHKLFESEEGDAFSLYAKTGASANAYTSFDRTAYLFSCTEQFEQSLDILLNFVTTPYFTAQTVEKEQGIIGQEIRMYDDNPDWRVFFNLLGAVYHNNPISKDIAGTVESIAEITPELLHKCYATFYNLNNMCLAVAGNFDPAAVLAAADKILKPAPILTVTRKKSDEPRSVRQKLVTQVLAVAAPQFHIGFKGVPKSSAENMRVQIINEVILDIIAGESTTLYREMYDSGLINQTFGTEAMSGDDYSLAIFSGESRAPEKVFDLITAEIIKMRDGGINSDVFSRVKKAMYGRYIGMTARTESVAGLLVSTHFAGFGFYQPLDLIADLTIQDVTDVFLENFVPEYSALSIVRGA